MSACACACAAGGERLAEGDACVCAKGIPLPPLLPLPTDAGDAPPGPAQESSSEDESPAAAPAPPRRLVRERTFTAPSTGPGLRKPEDASTPPEDVSTTQGLVGHDDTSTAQDFSRSEDLFVTQGPSEPEDASTTIESEDTSLQSPPDTSTALGPKDTPSAQCALDTSTMQGPEDTSAARSLLGAQDTCTTQGLNDAPSPQSDPGAEDSYAAEGVQSPEGVCARESTPRAESAPVAERPSAAPASSAEEDPEALPAPCAASAPSGDRGDCGGGPKSAEVASTPSACPSAGHGSLNPNCLELASPSQPDENEFSGYRPCRKAMKPPGGESRDLWGAEFKGTPCHHRVLKPPGGGSSDIFGPSEPVQNSPRRIRNNLQSSVFGPPAANGEATPRTKPGMDSYNRLFGPADSRPQSATKNRLKSNIILSSAESTSPTKESNGYSPGKESVDAPIKDGNPVTGEGYAAEKQPSPVSNGQPAANGVNGAPASAPASAPAQRSRVPPGGFSSGLW